MLKAEIGTTTVYYTRGFELISRREGTTASYYVYDGGLSVRALTNEAGAVTDTLVFDAFGNETDRTETTDNPYGFQGEEQDATGLYYLRARYMDPATGTFTTMDTYGGSLSDPMSLHKYLFANSNPVMYSDPSGHFTMTEQMLVCGLIGELASSTLYLVELFTTDNIQYESVFHAAFGALKAVITGFAIGVVFCALHIVFAAIVGAAIASIVFGSFGAAMSILGIADGFLDYKKGDSTLGSVKVLMSIISLALSTNSVLNGIEGMSNSLKSDIYSFQAKNTPGKPGGGRPYDFRVNDSSSTISEYPINPKTGKLMGASTCLDPKQTTLSGEYYLLPKGTVLPEGLAWYQDSANHGVLYPTQEMTVNDFNKLYYSLPWKFSGSI